jgi:cytochrome c oxidase subunit 3
MPSHTLEPEVQYATLEQQSETAQLGLWVFLATETLFFGALLLGYTVLRHAYPEGFAEAGKETKLVIGTVNTAVLLTSSATMAWAVHAAEIGHRRLLTRLLATTAGLGVVFLALKGLEYSLEYKEKLVPGINFDLAKHGPIVELFYFIYFTLTGLHAVHLTIGIGIVSVMMVRAWRGAFSPVYYTPIEITGLYWHFVDFVWIFVYPLIYLMGRNSG